MRQLLLVLVVAAAAVAVQAEEAVFEVPCDDDGLAHIPALPEGARRPYSVRKRSRTVHRDSEVTDDTPKLPPGQRRFDAVLPDEQGSDISSSSAPSQRRLALGPTDSSPPPPRATREDSNEVLDGEARPTRRQARRRAYPKKAVENYPVENYPVENYPAEHDPKQDAVVDSLEAVRSHPTHLPEGADDNLTDNEVAAPTAAAARVPADQVALEDVSVEQLDPDLPPGYKSKFPQRTFASDAAGGGGSGDVLRIKPRKRVNQYHREEQPQEGRHRPSSRYQDVDAADGAQVTPDLEQTLDLEQRPLRRRPRPRPAQDEQDHERQPLRRRPRPRPVEPVAELDPDSNNAVAPTSQPEVVDVDVQPRRRPLRRRPRPQQVVGDLDNAEVVPQVAVDTESRTQQAPRRRPRPGLEGRRRPAAASEEGEGQQGQQGQQGARGHGRRLSAGFTADAVPQVLVEHDGTAAERKVPEPTLVRSAVKKVATGGDPSPAVIQKIVKNTLRRLQPQIAEHEGDVGVDILVKIIQLDD